MSGSQRTPLPSSDTDDEHELAERLHPERTGRQCQISQAQDRADALSGQQPADIAKGAAEWARTSRGKGQLLSSNHAPALQRERMRIAFLYIAEAYQCYHVAVIALKRLGMLKKLVTRDNLTDLDKPRWRGIRRRRDTSAAKRAADAIAAFLTR